MGKKAAASVLPAAAVPIRWVVGRGNSQGGFDSKVGGIG